MTSCTSCSINVLTDFVSKQQNCHLATFSFEAIYSQGHNVPIRATHAGLLTEAVNGKLVLCLYFA